MRVDLLKVIIPFQNEQRRLARTSFNSSMETGSVDVSKKTCYYQIKYDPRRKTELAETFSAQA